MSFAVTFYCDLIYLTVFTK